MSTCDRSSTPAETFQVPTAFLRRNALVAYHLILIAHLFGLALGMGGASTIDSIFLVACRRKRVTPELVNVIHAAAGLVAAAMVLLAVSGGAFFLVGAEPSPKFWAKLIIVGIACLNGLVAHQLIFPLIEQACETGNGSLSFRPWPARLAAATAAISGVSWSAAMILGSWHGLKLGMTPILAAYGVILFGAIVFSAFVIAPRVFDISPPERRRPPADLVADLAYQFSLMIAESALSFAEHLRRRSDASQSSGTAVIPGPNTPRSRGHDCHRLMDVAGDCTGRHFRQRIPVRYLAGCVRAGNATGAGSTPGSISGRIDEIRRRAPEPQLFLTRSKSGTRPTPKLFLLASTPAGLRDPQLDPGSWLCA